MRRVYADIASLFGWPPEMERWDWAELMWWHAEALARLEALAKPPDA